MTSVSENSVVVVTDRQVSSEFVDEEMVILDVHDGAYYHLNPLGARIWGMIQTPTPVRKVVADLLEEYEVTADRCTREVIELLQDLVDRKLVEVQVETA